MGTSPADQSLSNRGSPVTDVIRDKQATARLNRRATYRVNVSPHCVKTRPKQKMMVHSILRSFERGPSRSIDETFGDRLRCHVSRLTLPSPKAHVAGNHSSMRGHAMRRPRPRGSRRGLGTSFRARLSRQPEKDENGASPEAIPAGNSITPRERAPRWRARPGKWTPVRRCMVAAGGGAHRSAPWRCLFPQAHHRVTLAGTPVPDGPELRGCSGRWAPCGCSTARCAPWHWRS